MSEDLTRVHCWCFQTHRQCSGRGTLLAWSCLAPHPGSGLERLLAAPAAVAGLGDHHPAAVAVVEQPDHWSIMISIESGQDNS